MGSNELVDTNMDFSGCRWTERAHRARPVTGVRFGSKAGLIYLAFNRSIKLSVNRRSPLNSLVV
jgi:hypothetical protein